MFKEFLILLNTNAMYKWDISVRSYHDGKNILKIELDTDDKKYWSKELNLERKIYINIEIIATFKIKIMI